MSVKNPLSDNLIICIRRRNALADFRSAGFFDVKPRTTRRQATHVINVDTGNAIGVVKKVFHRISHHFCFADLALLFGGWILTNTRAPLPYDSNGENYAKL